MLSKCELFSSNIYLNIGQGHHEEIKPQPSRRDYMFIEDLINIVRWMITFWTTPTAACNGVKYSYGSWQVKHELL